MAPHFARLLREIGQELPDSKPTLEINPQHALLKRAEAARRSADQPISRSLHPPCDGPAKNSSVRSSRWPAYLSVSTRWNIGNSGAAAANRVAHDCSFMSSG